MNGGAAWTGSPGGNCCIWACSCSNKLVTKDFCILPASDHKGKLAIVGRSSTSMHSIVLVLKLVTISILRDGTSSVANACDISDRPSIKKLFGLLQILDSFLLHILDVFFLLLFPSYHICPQGLYSVGRCRLLRFPVLGLLLWASGMLLVSSAIFPCPLGRVIRAYVSCRN